MAENNGFHNHYKIQTPKLGQYNMEQCNKIIIYSLLFSSIVILTSMSTQSLAICRTAWVKDPEEILAVYPFPSNSWTVLPSTMHALLLMPEELPPWAQTTKLWSWQLTSIYSQQSLNNYNFKTRQKANCSTELLPTWKETEPLPGIIAFSIDVLLFVSPENGNFNYHRTLNSQFEPFDP
jgi:hypothetical protein